MINRKHKLCYVPVSKSASTSLRPLLHSSGFTKWLGRYGHGTLKDAEIKYGCLDDYKVFIVYREPVERLKSLHKHLLKHDPKCKNNTIEDTLVHKSCNRLTEHWCVNLKGKVHIDIILDINNLQTDLDNLFKFYGLPVKKIPRLNVINKNIKLTSTQEINIIKLFKKDIELYKNWSNSYK